MAKKIYILLIALVASVGFYFVLQLGFKERPIVKMKWTEFADQTALAQSLYTQLESEIRDHSVIFFGVEPDDKAQLLLAKNWLNFVQVSPLQFDEVLIEPRLNYREENFASAGLFDIRVDHKEFIKHLQEQIANNKRILVILPQVYASQIIKDNPVSRIIKDSQIAILSISLVPLASTRLPCVIDGVDYTGESALGCLAHDKLRLLQSKAAKIVKGATVPSEASPIQTAAVLEKFGGANFTLFIK